MATKIVMEALSPTMEEGRMVKWLKNEGDAIAKGDILAEVETDKAVMELVARGEGILRKRLAAEGDTRPVGTLLGVIAGAEEDIDAVLGSAGGTSAKPAADVVGTTQESPGATSVPQNAAQSQGEASTPPQQKESPRVGRDVPAEPPASRPAAQAQPPAPPAGTAAAQPAVHHGNGERARSSPVARRMASERGLDLSALRGTGPGGRIIKRDVESAAAAPAAAGQAGADTAQPPRLPVPGAGGPDYQDVPLTQLRKTIAKRLSESIGPIPTFYLTDEYDMERVAEMRAAMAAMGDEFKVSFNDILIKAVASALTLHPEVNAQWLGDRIRYWSRVHIGMAVAIEDGLITPVLFDAATKGLSEIAREARELARRARDRKLTPDEYTGSTFSISNLGMFGIDQFTAIINPPEAGILAVGAVERKPVVVDGAVVPRMRMRVTMSCDHRVVDGATGARFLQTLRRMLENPLMLVW